MLESPRAPTPLFQTDRRFVDRRRTIGQRGLGALTGFCAAAVPLGILRGFMVDDAWITARIAYWLASGHGHVFNPAGPSVDAITPLGWVLVLVPFAGVGPGGAFLAAKWLGAISWLAAATWLGGCIGELPGTRWRFTPLLVLLVCAPLASWGVAGMETGVVTALATLALSPRWSSAMAIGLAAAWRPELIPWGATLALGRVWARQGKASEALACGVIALAPAILVALARAMLFGDPAPLAVYAKPADPYHGLIYVAGGLIWTGPAWLILAPGAWHRLSRHAKVILLASLVHLGALILAGGDWMPLFRLFVPVLPGWLLVGAVLTQLSGGWFRAGRLGAALTVSLWMLGKFGRDLQAVGERRRHLVEHAAPLLAGAQRVAALDIGWVGFATEHHVIDVSGVTDPTVAVLPGPHTNKRLPSDFVESRQVDCVVVQLANSDALGRPWFATEFYTGVDARLAEQAGDLGMVPWGFVPLPGTRRGYLIAGRSSALTGSGNELR